MSGVRLAQNELETMAYYDQHAIDLARYYEGLQIFGSGMEVINQWYDEVNKFTELLPESPRVLALGAGTAFDAGFFHDAGAWYVGIDISRVALALASERQAQPALARMSMRNLGIADNSFDGAWMLDSIHFLTNDQLLPTFKEVKRVLRPGGYLYMVIIGIGESDAEERFENRQSLYPMARYTRAEIDTAVGKAGLSLVDFYPDSIDDDLSTVIVRST